MELAWKRRGQAELMTLEVAEKSTEEMQYLGGHEISKPVANLHRQLGHPRWIQAGAGGEGTTPSQWICPGGPEVQVPHLFGQGTTQECACGDLAHSPTLQPLRGHRHLLREMGWKTTCGLHHHGGAQSLPLRDWHGDQGGVCRHGDSPLWISLESIFWLPESAATGCLWSSSRCTLCWLGVHPWNVFGPDPSRCRHGILERNHAVRRRMLEIFHRDMVKLSFEQAILTNWWPAIRETVWKVLRLPLWHLATFPPKEATLTNLDPNTLSDSAERRSWRSNRRLHKPSTLPNLTWRFDEPLWPGRAWRRTSSWWETTSTIL